MFFANELKLYEISNYLKLRSIFFQVPDSTNRNLLQGTFQGTLDTINFMHMMFPLWKH